MKTLSSFSQGVVKAQRAMGTHYFSGRRHVLSAEESVLEVLLSTVCTRYIHAASQ